MRTLQRVLSSQVCRPPRPLIQKKSQGLPGVALAPGPLPKLQSRWSSVKKEGGFQVKDAGQEGAELPAVSWSLGLGQLPKWEQGVSDLVLLL